MSVPTISITIPADEAQQLLEQLPIARFPYSVLELADVLAEPRGTRTQHSNTSAHVIEIG